MTIAKKIGEEIFKPAFSFKTSIFLCGADINQKTTIRHKISETLISSEFILCYTSSLFFCKADKFSDPFEGSIPKGEVIEIEESFTIA